MFIKELKGYVLAQEIIDMNSFQTAALDFHLVSNFCFAKISIPTRHIDKHHKDLLE